MCEAIGPERKFYDACALEAWATEDHIKQLAVRNVEIVRFDR